MSKGANKSFINFTRAFLKSKHISIDSSNYGALDQQASNNQDLVTLDLRLLKTSSIHQMTKNGALTPSYNLIPYSGNTRTFSHPIKAYWLQWQDQGMPSIQLGSQASFLFTPELSGCTIYVDRGNAYSPTVYHRDASASVQVPNHTQSYGPAQYDPNATSADRALLVGMRFAFGWWFYSQRYQLVGQTNLVSGPHQDFTSFGQI